MSNSNENTPRQTLSAAGLAGHFASALQNQAGEADTGRAMSEALQKSASISPEQAEEMVFKAMHPRTGEEQGAAHKNTDQQAAHPKPEKQGLPGLPGGEISAQTRAVLAGNFLRLIGESE